MFALLKRHGLRTYHGLRCKHIDSYLNEFVFRFNHRYYRYPCFETLLGLSAHRAATSYWDITGRITPRKGAFEPGCLWGRGADRQRLFRLDAGRPGNTRIAPGRSC